MFEENLVENQMMEKQEENEEDQIEENSSDDDNSQSEDEFEDANEDAIVYSKSKNIPSNPLIKEKTESTIIREDKNQTNYEGEGDHLMSEDPVYMVVLKHALKQRRQSLHKKRRQSLKKSSVKKKNQQQQVSEELVIEEEIESTKSSNTMLEMEDPWLKNEKDCNDHNIETSSTNKQHQIVANSPKAGKHHHQINNNNNINHSRSSSDISIASEEVREINRKTFISACPQRQQLHIGGRTEVSKGIGVKPAIPVIPSPDYTVPDEGTKHPHHVYRPFWSDNDEETSSSKVSTIFDTKKNG